MRVGNAMKCSNTGQHADVNARGVCVSWIDPGWRYLTMINDLRGFLVGRNHYALIIVEDRKFDGYRRFLEKTR